MKATLILILLLICNSLTAPPSNLVQFEKPKPIYKKDPMLFAFMHVESNFRTNIVNSLGYTGILQIGQEMINEANRINVLTGNPIRFKFPESALDSLQSVHVWYTVQKYWNPKYSLIKAAKIWNPLASEMYLTRIKKLI